MPYLAPDAAHADQFLRAEIGREEGQAGDPDRDGPAGGQEIVAGGNALLRPPSRCPDEGEIQRENRVVDEM